MGSGLQQKATAKSKGKSKRATLKTEGSGTRKGSSKTHVREKRMMKPHCGFGYLRHG